MISFFFTKILIYFLLNAFNLPAGLLARLLTRLGTPALGTVLASDPGQSTLIFGILGALAKFRMKALGANIAPFALGALKGTLAKVTLVRSS